MTNYKVGLATFALALVVAAPLAAQDSAVQEAEEIRDANGRLIETVEPDGIRAQYIYDNQGVLQEIRYSDGRVEHLEPQPE
jgi:YD repeat-containing protein